MQSMTCKQRLPLFVFRVHLFVFHEPFFVAAHAVKVTRW